MYSIKYTSQCQAWLNGVKDNTTQLRLKTRLRKAQLGNLGDVKSVGTGVYEMREHFAGGWRMYYIVRGDVLIVMLGGGNKSTQSRDIAAAIALSELIKE